MIVTNNPRFINNDEKVFNNVDILFLDKDAIDVLKKARDLIHQNYKLLTHPLYGNFRVIETFYRTLILEKVGKIDLDSINLIENSILKTLDILNKSNKRSADFKMLDDFSYIDYQIILENMRERR